MRRGRESASSGHDQRLPLMSGLLGERPAKPAQGTGQTKRAPETPRRHCISGEAEALSRLSPTGRPGMASRPTCLPGG
jgi:hypothetical protein